MISEITNVYNSTIQSYKILELADAFQGSAVLFFANKEELFNLLENPITAKEISSIKNWQIWKTEILLNALVALDLAIKQQNKYSNTKLTSTILVKGKSTFQGDIVEHERLQWNLWNSLDKVMTSENATTEQQDVRLIQESYDNNVFHNAMMQLADELIDYVIKIEGWETKKKVIDLAGGHGLYLAKLAAKHPQLCGEIWDLESANQSANVVITEFNLANKVKFCNKDITQSASYINQKCDGILINHCLHHFKPQEASDILKACVDILENGGIISLVESFLETDKTSPSSNALFSMYMMVNRQFGQVHSSDWIANELSKHGLQVEVNRINNPADDALIVARKK